jgi:hypothetical protein
MSENAHYFEIFEKFLLANSYELLIQTDSIGTCSLNPRTLRARKRPALKGEVSSFEGGARSAVSKERSSAYGDRRNPLFCRGGEAGFGEGKMLRV